MKTLRLTVHWDVEEVVGLIDTLDQIRAGLLTAYATEIDHYQQQRWSEQQTCYQSQPDLFNLAEDI